MLKIYRKYEEIINYLIVGVLTTLISVLSYALFAKVFHIHYMVSNIISWILSVLFAYITNKKYVFKSTVIEKKAVLKEMIDFFKYRILSFLIDVSLMYMFVSLLKVDDMISKVLVQILIIILNYVFSKIFVFKESQK